MWILRTHRPSAGHPYINVLIIHSSSSSLCIGENHGTVLELNTTKALSANIQETIVKHCLGT